MAEPMYWPDGTVRLPAALRQWVDGHCEGGMDDDADEIERDHKVVTVALWSLLYPRLHRHPRVGRAHRFSLMLEDPHHRSRPGQRGVSTLTLEHGEN